MIFRVGDGKGGVQTYEGFRFYRVPESLNMGETLIVVEYDGEPDMWIVEGKEGLAELARMYRMEDAVDFELPPWLQFQDAMPISMIVRTYQIRNPHCEGD